MPYGLVFQQALGKYAEVYVVLVLLVVNMYLVTRAVYIKFMHQYMRMSGTLGSPFMKRGPRMRNVAGH